MRILYEEKECELYFDKAITDKPIPVIDDPLIPDISFLRDNPEQALVSFYTTVNQLMEDNPVDIPLLTQLSKKAKSSPSPTNQSAQQDSTDTWYGKLIRLLTQLFQKPDLIPASVLSEEESKQLSQQKAAATRQGKAVGACYGFFFRYKPYPMFAEVRAKEKLFQPPFGPVLVVHGETVLDVLTRHHEFTVDPYGREMSKMLSPDNSDGFDTYILSTDDDSKYLEDKELLTSVVTREDATTITDLMHQNCMDRVRRAVNESRERGDHYIDVVTAVARFVPVTLGHDYFGVPAAKENSTFELTDDMLELYGNKVAGPDGKTSLPLTYKNAKGETIDLPDSALTKQDGIIPDELQVYLWIKAAFRNFFNNVKKDIPVQAEGVRATRELLVYIHREIEIQKKELEAGHDVPDNMMTRLLKYQLGVKTPELRVPENLDPARVSNLRIAENIMGTIVGAIAGQEEATCRVIDSIIRLQDNEFDQGDSAALAAGESYGSFTEAKALAMNVVEGHDVANSRGKLKQYALEALRLQPQGEVLLRECMKEGATIAGSRPIRKGTLIFASHASAMQDIHQPNTFIIGRDSQHYLQYGYGRHKCLGQYVSPVMMVEAMVAILALDNVRRPPSNPGEPTFPSERRFGRLQLDENNLYADSFMLEFDDSGTTKQYFGE